MEDNRVKSIHNSVFRVGVVSSVDGREVKIKMDRNKNSSHLIYKGNLIKNVSVGSYVKIMKGFMSIIGKVESEYIYENSTVNNKAVQSAKEIINRILVVKLIGFIDGLTFKRGVNELPLIDNECHLLSEKEFTMIHTFGSSHGEFIHIGHLANDALVSVSLGIGKLFSSHIGIFGNTGSGKSYTLSKLYHQLFAHYHGSQDFKNNSKFLFFDFNGEYSGENVIISGKKVYKLSTHDDDGDKIPMADNDFLDVNLLSIFSNATEKTQRPFLSRCISLYKTLNDDEEKFKNFLRGQIVEILQMSDKIKGDQLIDYVENILPKKYDANGVDLGLRSDFSFHNNCGCYYCRRREAFINFQERPQEIQNLTIYKQVDKFHFANSFIPKFICVMYMRMIYDMLTNRAMNEHIAPAINKLKQSEKDVRRVFSTSNNIAEFWGNSNIVIIDLSRVNTDTKKRIPLLLANKLYNEHKAVGKAMSYLNIVVDEAHNILSHQSTRESEEWKDYRLEVFEEIIKEGRKFGVFMTIASQRPSHFFNYNFTVTQLFHSSLG